MYVEFQEQIRSYAYEIGINKIGFTDASPFHELEPKLREQIAQDYQSGFEHPIVEERINPQLLMPDAQSIIAIALAYPSRPLTRIKHDKAKPRGSFARASWGEDYHFILRRKLNQLIEYIERNAPSYGIDNVSFKPMVDTGELSDVSVAARAGLGFIGRNGLLITKEYGSYLYLGEIITNIAFKQDNPVSYDCGDCYRCIDACPTGALLGNGSMNAKKCLSYQTQTKTLMPLQYRQRMGRVIYGCDICQVVCPYNLGMDVHDHPEMEPEMEAVFPELRPMLFMSNREFKEKFGQMAGSWRGKKPLQRNAIIALANGRELNAVTDLMELIESDPRPEIRGTAAWAMGEILSGEQNDEVVEFLTIALEKEEQEEVIEEYHLAIQLITTK